MNRLPLLFLCVVLGACSTKPVKTTQVREPGFRSTEYGDFRTRRVEELQRMGGPFSERGVAEQKATEEANARYGEPAPDVTTTWEWGKGAGRKAAQADVVSTLEKMQREETKR